jgi:hypothetical protein
MRIPCTKDLCCCILSFHQMNCWSDLIWNELRKFGTGLNNVICMYMHVIDQLYLDLGPSHSTRYSELEVCQQQDKKSICMEQVVAMILS